MAQQKPPVHVRQVVFRVITFLLIGLFTGLAWFASLMPVGMLSLAGIDFMRYAFAAGVMVALVGLFYRPWRAYGLGLFFVGMLVGIFLWYVLVPMNISLGTRLLNSLVLFGVPLGITSFLAIGFFLARLRHEYGSRSTEVEEEGARGAPRRFGMGTLMCVVLAVAAFFSAADWLELSPIFSIFTGCFLGIICGFQMLMDKVPRAASVVTGAVLLPLTFAATWPAISANLSPVVAALIMTTADMCFVGAHCVAFGAVAGYIGGVLVAGLFLVIDLAGRPLRHRHAVHPSV